MHCRTDDFGNLKYYETLIYFITHKGKYEYCELSTGKYLLVKLIVVMNFTYIIIFTSTNTCIISTYFKSNFFDRTDDFDT